MSKKNLFKGLAGAFLGLLASCVGMAPIDAYRRFTFGNYNLYGGLDRVAVILGLFAICIVLVDYAKRANDYVIEENSSKLRGFGVTLGAGLSNLVAYGQAQNASKKPEEFGRGNIEGIFASETSNNASVGGSLIPMSTLGIPGDATTAVLLGGLNKYIYYVGYPPQLFDLKIDPREMNDLAADPSCLHTGQEA